MRDDADSYYLWELNSPKKASLKTTHSSAYPVSTRLQQVPKPRTILSVVLGQIVLVSSHLHNRQESPLPYAVHSNIPHEWMTRITNQGLGPSFSIYSLIGDQWSNVHAMAIPCPSNSFRLDTSPDSNTNSEMATAFRSRDKEPRSGSELGPEPGPGPGPGPAIQSISWQMTCTHSFTHTQLISWSMSISAVVVSRTYVEYTSDIAPKRKRTRGWMKIWDTLF